MRQKIGDVWSIKKKYKKLYYYKGPSVRYFYDKEPEKIEPKRFFAESMMQSNLYRLRKNALKVIEEDKLENCTVKKGTLYVTNWMTS